MIKMRRLRTSLTLLFVFAAMMSCITASQAGILKALRERMRPNSQAQNRNLPGPAPFAPSNGPFFMVESDPAALGGPHHQQMAPLGGPVGSGPSPLHRSGSFGPGSYGAISEEGGPSYNYEDGPIEGSESGRQASAGAGGVVSPQQLNVEFAQADGVTPQEAGANDDDDDFGDFDHESAQVQASSRQQKKSVAPSNRRQGGYNGYRYAEPNHRRPMKNNKNKGKKQPQYAQERQNNPDDREPNDFFPYREFGEQPDRDGGDKAEYEEYGDYTENLDGPVAADGPQGRPDPELDLVDRPEGGGGGGRDQGFDFDYDDRDQGPGNDGLRDPDLDGPVDDRPGEGRPGGFPGFGGGDGEREEGGEGGETSDDRVLNEGDDLPLGGPGGPGRPGGPNGGRGSFFGGLRNRGSGGRPGAPANRFSLFGRGR